VKLSRWSLVAALALATLLVVVGVGSGVAWVAWLGGLWACVELSFRSGVRLGDRFGYDRGVDDGMRQVSGW